jgi:hypothetical protein
MLLVVEDGLKVVLAATDVDVDVKTELDELDCGDPLEMLDTEADTDNEDVEPEKVTQLLGLPYMTVVVR